MRTKTIQYKVYTFDELSDESKRNALEHIGTGLMETYDPDTLTEQFAEILAEWGFPTDDIEWSLSHSQGDGVAFYGQIDIQKFVTHTKQRTRFRSILALDPYAHITRNSWGTHYSHFNTMDVSIDYYAENELTRKQDKNLAELEKTLKDTVVEVSKRLESIGYAEFDHLTSEESIKELIEINEWEFTEDGRIA